MKTAAALACLLLLTLATTACTTEDHTVEPPAALATNQAPTQDVRAATTPTQAATSTVADTSTTAPTPAPPSPAPTGTAPPPATLPPPTQDQTVSPTAGAAQDERPPTGIGTILTDAERQCLEGHSVPVEHLPEVMYDPKPVIACLSEESLDGLIGMMAAGQNPEITDTAQACLAAQGLAAAVKARPPAELGPATYVLVAAAAYALAGCLDPGQWSSLGYAEPQRRLFSCMADAGISAAQVVTAGLDTADETAARRIEQAATGCEEPDPPPYTPGPEAGDHPVFPAAANLARRHTVSGEEPRLVSAQEYTWSNGAMGCPTAGGIYTEALIDGYVLHIAVGDRTVRIHSNREGTILFVPANCIGGPTP